MKKQLLLLLSLSVFLGYSQAPIANYESDDGSKFAITDLATSTVDNSPTGANATWNFTGLVKDSETVDSYDNPTAQELIDYPNTTYVFTATRNGVSGKIFSEDNAGAISITGVEGEGLILEYSDVAQGGNALIGTFPLSFGTAATVDNVAGNFTYVPFNIMGTFIGTITSEVDAYGTLTVSGTDIIPFSGSVTRLKVVQDLDMSVANGNINQITYNYYDDITGNLVFRTSTLAITSAIINDTTVVTESLIEIVLGVSEKNVSDLNIFPNPVKNQLNISFYNNVKIKSILAYDLSGRQVISIEENTNSVDVSQLKPGLYILNVITNKGTLSSKFIKE